MLLIGAGCAGTLLIGAGCAGMRSDGAFSRIPGVAALEYDGLDLVVESEEVDGLFMLSGGVERMQVNLRIGETFAISDGQRRLDEYEVLALAEERVILKRTTTLDRRAEREGVRRTSKVITVTPYRPERRDEP